MEDNTSNIAERMRRQRYANTIWERFKDKDRIRKFLEEYDNAKDDTEKQLVVLFHHAD